MQSNKSQKNITFLINSLTNGGAERVVLTLAEKLLNEGQKVTVVSLTKNNRYTLPHGLQMVYLSNSDDSGHALTRTLLIPFYAWRLKRYIKKEQIALVQSHLFRANYVNVFSRVLGAKHQVQVVNHSVVSRFLSSGIGGEINLFLMRYLYPKVDLIVTISHKMLEDLNQLFSFSNSSVVIHNPYDTQNIVALSYEKIDEFYFNSQKSYLITVGRLIALKKYDDVLQALAKLPEHIELILLGEDGGEQKALEALTKTLQITHRVHFLGHVKNPFKFIKRCDLFILSSKTEGFPNVIIEAMLCKTAVISSDCISGPREILAPNTSIKNQLQKGVEKATYGLLYSVGDIKALKEAIEELIKDKKYRIAYTEKAYQQAKNFSIEKIILEYKQILKGKR